MVVCFFGWNYTRLCNILRAVLPCEICSSVNSVTSGTVHIFGGRVSLFSFQTVQYNFFSGRLILAHECFWCDSFLQDVDLYVLLSVSFVGTTHVYRALSVPECLFHRKRGIFSRVGSCLRDLLYFCTTELPTMKRMVCIN